MLKNRILITIMFIMLAIPVFSIESEQVDNKINNTESIETTVDKTMEQSADIVDNNEEKNINTPYKQPVSKKKIAKKFLLAMMGVIVSSVIIFLGLSLYNKIRYNLFSQNIVTNRNKDSLEKPQNLTEAIKAFIDKTQWGE